MNNFHRGKKDAFFFWKEHAFGSVALKNGGGIEKKMKRKTR